MFPTAVFRRAYDRLCAGRVAHSADLEYIRILHWAATTWQTRVEAALQDCLQRGARPDFEQLRTAVGAARPELESACELRLSEPDLAVYDQLLGRESA